MVLMVRQFAMKIRRDCSSPSDCSLPVPSISDQAFRSGLQSGKSFRALKVVRLSPNVSHHSAHEDLVKVSTPLRRLSLGCRSPLADFPALFAARFNPDLKDKHQEFTARG